MTRLQRKQEFIKRLAAFFSDNAAKKSIQLQMRDPWAEEWAALRNTTPLLGYLSREETEAALTEFLG